jgi:hypothetical protein
MHLFVFSFIFLMITLSNTGRLREPPGEESASLGKQIAMQDALG